MGGGGTRLLAAAPEGGEEAEPAAPPARHRSLRTGISGGSPGASVAGAEPRPSGTARSRSRSPHAEAAAAAARQAQGLPAAPPRPPIGPRGCCGKGGTGRRLAAAAWARASSRQARPRAVMGNVVFERDGETEGTKRVRRSGLVVVTATWRRPRCRAEPGRTVAVGGCFFSRRDVERLPPVVVGPLPDRPVPPTACCRCRERPGGAGRGSGLRPTSR